MRFTGSLFAIWSVLALGVAGFDNSRYDNVSVAFPLRKPSIHIVTGGTGIATVPNSPFQPSSPFHRRAPQLILYVDMRDLIFTHSRS